MSGTTSTEALAEILGIVQETQQGLAFMLETQALHSEMLEKLMQAATKAPGPSPLHDAVQRVASELEKQSAILIRVDTNIEALLLREGGEVPVLEGDGLQADQDGVILVGADGPSSGQNGTGNGHVKDER